MTDYTPARGHFTIQDYFLMVYSKPEKDPVIYYKPHIEKVLKKMGR
jgi:hypothetical protein